MNRPELKFGLIAKVSFNGLKKIQPVLTGFSFQLEIYFKADFKAALKAISQLQLK